DSSLAPYSCSALFFIVFLLFIVIDSLSLSFIFLCLPSFFFFHDTPTTEIYTLSLHDAFRSRWPGTLRWNRRAPSAYFSKWCCRRSEEHTSELQSRFDLVCRLLLEKKKYSE